MLVRRRHVRRRAPRARAAGGARPCLRLRRLRRRRRPHRRRRAVPHDRRDEGPGLAGRPRRRGRRRLPAADAPDQPRAAATGRTAGPGGAERRRSAALDRHRAGRTRGDRRRPARHAHEDALSHRPAQLRLAQRPAALDAAAADAQRRRRRPLGAWAHPRPGGCDGVAVRRRPAGRGRRGRRRGARRPRPARGEERDAPRPAAREAGVLRLRRGAGRHRGRRAPIPHRRRRLAGARIPAAQRRPLPRHLVPGDPVERRLPDRRLPHPARHGRRALGRHLLRRRGRRRRRRRLRRPLQELRQRPHRERPGAARVAQRPHRPNQGLQRRQPSAPVRRGRRAGHGRLSRRRLPGRAPAPGCRSSSPSRPGCWWCTRRGSMRRAASR